MYKIWFSAPINGSEENSLTLYFSFWVFPCLFFLGSSGRIEIWFALHLIGEFALARFVCVVRERERDREKEREIDREGGEGNINIIFGPMWILIAAARKLCDTN